MPHRLDQFGRVLGQFAAGAGHPDKVIIPSFFRIPAPGDSDLGNVVGGIITDIIQRIPLPIPRPRPRLPGPKGPTTTGPTFPFPFPFPVPGGFLGSGECPEQTCCRGEHVAKTKNPNDPSFGKCVTNRRMNPLNPRALKRAIRRATRFEAFVKSNRKSLRKLAKI